jgi:dUTP pyrophosphatase
MEDIEKIKQKILDIINPNVDYTQEDFDKEFGNMNYTNNSFKLNINFVNKSNNPNPEYATSGSSGIDLRANLDEDVKLSPQGGFAIIPTGLYFELPHGFEIQVRSRSGLAAKNQVVVLNSPGTIDSDYRGELKVILINHGLNEFYIKHGDRIAQAVFASVINETIINLNQVQNISSDTQRSSGGFGSTGLR